MQVTPKIQGRALIVGWLLVAALVPFARCGYGQTGSASWSAFPFTASVPNDPAVGTVINHLAKLTSAGKAVLPSVNDTTGILGIVVQGAGTTGWPIVAAGGQAPCAFDGATVAGDYVQASSSVAGDCHDAGAAYPAVGDVIGRLASTNPATGTYMVLVFPGEQKPVTGNASTATALAATPSTCSIGLGQVATGIQSTGNAVCSQLPSATAASAGVVQLGTAATNAVAGNDSRLIGALQSSALGTAGGPAQLDVNAKFPWVNLSGIPGFGSAAYQASGAFDAAGAATSAVAAIPTATGTASGLLATADWNTFNGKQSALGLVNVKDYGAKGDGSTDDTAAIQKALTLAGTSGSTAYFPTGTYMVSTPLEVSSSVKFSDASTIRASVAMSAVLRIGSAAALVNGFIRGGIIDANNLANDGVIARQYRHIQIQDVVVLNAVTNGFHMGDSTLSGSSYEGIVTGVHTMRVSGTLTAGSAGILIDSNATDNNVADSVLVASDIGVKTLTGGNFFTNIHVWSGQSSGWMSVGFDDYALGNFWKGCEADTVSTYGIRLRSYNSIVQGCRFYNNNVYGQDNVAIGIHFDQAAPYATLQGNIFQGSDGTHRIATDIDISATYALTSIGNQDVNVVTQLAAGMVINGTLAAAGTVSAHGSLLAVPVQSATASANNGTTLSLNANYWNTTTASQNNYAWNINTGQNATGTLTQPQLYFYMTGTVPAGVTGTLVYGANAAVSGQNNSSLRHAYQSSYYDGTCSCVKYDTWSIQNAIGGGANNPTNPTSTFSIFHSGSPGVSTVAVPALTVGGDTPFSAAPRLMWSTFGACSPQYSNCYESALWTPGKPISITQWTLNMQTPPAGCTAYPVISIKQGTNVLASVTTLPGQGDYTSTAGFPIAINPANGALRVLVAVAGTSCSAYGYGVASNLEYVMQ